MKNVNGLSWHLRARQGKLDVCELGQVLLFCLFSAYQLGLHYNTAQVNHSLSDLYHLETLYSETWKREKLYFI